MPVQTQILIRRDTASNWTTQVLGSGEFGFDTTNKRLKIGDGTTAWGSLGYIKAGTATTLETARTINGVSFDGSANITVTADANTLTNTTLASNVVSSSLTSVGTITSGTWSGSFGAVSGANLTSLNGSNIASGTVAFARLAALYLGTTSIQSSSANQAITGISSISFPGSTSGTAILQATATAGTPTISLPTSTGTLALTSAIPSVYDGSLTLAVSGTGLSGSASFSANSNTPTTFTVTSNATAVNTASTIVARDSSGNFAATTVTAALAGNASTATKLQTARNINGVAFDGTADITVTTATPSTLTIGTGLSGTSYNGGAPVTIAIDSTVATLTGSQALTNKTITTAAGTATVPPLKLTSGTNLTTATAGSVEYDGTNLYFSPSTTRKTVAFIDGNVATATTLQTSRNINGTAFNGSADITVTAAAGTLTGTALNSTVVTSSLTAVGTITTGTWSGLFGSVTGANLTNLTAANLVGTIPSAVLGASTVYIGSTAVLLNRATGNLALTGISSINMPGGTSGTLQLQPSGISGTTTLTFPAPVGGSGTIALTSDLPVASSTSPAMDGTATVGSATTYARADHVHPTDTSRAPLASPTFTGTLTAPIIVDSGLTVAGYVTNTSGGQLGTVATIPNVGLTNSTISGVALGSNLNTLTISSPLSGTSYNGSGAVSIGLSAAYGDTTNPYGSKTANFVLAAPNGSAGTPSFRALVAADIPNIAESQVTNLTTDLAAKAPLVSPSFTTPTLGVATATSINKLTITAPATGSTLTVADGKTLTVNNTLTFSGTDSSTLNIGTGGTLGTGAFATIANYAPLASPSFTTPSLGVATATSINGTTIPSSTTLLSVAGGTFTGALTLRAGTATAGTAPLYFGTTSPVVLTTPAAGAVEFDGVAFYSTPNATTGRAVLPSSYYYISDGSYSIDHSVSATAKSIFGGAAVGLTLIAGTTYELELMVYTSQTLGTVATPSYNHSFLLTTVSGSPVTTIYQQFSLASNTTSFATATSPTTLVNTANTATQVLASVTTGSRYSVYNVKGIIRVTGTGSVELSPAIAASSTSPDYLFLARAGSYIKITPIGNGTVTGVGIWA